LAKKSSVVEKKVEKPPRVARVLKLLDEEEGSKAGGPVEALSKPIPQVCAPIEESVEVIEALVNKRKLTKVAESEVPIVEPTASVAKAVNVVGFLVARRKNDVD
jgi:hypothetical protein